MMYMQNYFEKFYQHIKTGYDSNRELKGKKDSIISMLKNKIPNHLIEKIFCQGSYAIGTGIKPEVGDYDIDIGIIFKSTINHPAEVKHYIKNILSHGNRKIIIKNPCVTIQYMENFENRFHVDIAIYKRGSLEKIFFSRGKDINAKWEDANPEGLLDYINGEPNRRNQEQFRRIVCILKYWFKYKLEIEKLPSIALTIVARKIFNTATFYKSDVTIMSEILDHLISCIHFNKGINLPVDPCSNLIENMTYTQRLKAIEKISSLRDELQNTNITMLSGEDPCNTSLHRNFGPDFGNENMLHLALIQNPDCGNKNALHSALIQHPDSGTCNASHLALIPK